MGRFVRAAPATASGSLSGKLIEIVHASCGRVSLRPDREIDHDSNRHLTDTFRACRRITLRP
ncbi:hypothetical protein FMEAI12_2570011 [Parafrankia sp. Ea1.12]|nr:hypothetical protein FMEAI12_2570011 [Parafrankia sp. Ea1.12]